MNARIERKENSISNESVDQKYTLDKSKLATETFAKIYISQGQLSEAIKIYKHLAEINPEKREYYLERIEKIKSR